MLRPYKGKIQALSEAGRAFGGSGEGAFQGDAGATEGAFVKKAADERDAVGNTARRRKFWKRIVRVGGPVGASFGDFDKAGAQRERRMAGVVGDGEHFVAKGRDQEQVDVRKNARHFLTDFAAEAVGLYEINGGKKARLAEEIRPGVVRLHFELIVGVGKREFFEGGGSFGEEIEIERAVGPVGEKNFNGDHAELLEGVESGAIDIGGGSLLHPCGEVANAKTLDGSGGIEIELAGNAGDVAGIKAGDGLENEESVFDGASHGAELVERPAQGHRAGARNATVSGAKTSDAAAHAGADDAAASFAADREADKGRGGGSTWAGAGAGSAFFEQPGVHGLPAEPNIVEGERAETELCDEDGAGVVQALHDGGILSRDAIAKRFGAVSGGDSGGIEKIFTAPGDAMKRAAIFSGGEFGVGAFGLREREIMRESDDAAKLRIEFLDAAEINVGEAFGREFALLDPARELSDGSKSYVGVVGRERAGISVGAGEAILLRCGVLAGED